MPASFQGHHLPFTLKEVVLCHSSRTNNQVGVPGADAVESADLLVGSALRAKVRVAELESEEEEALWVRQQQLPMPPDAARRAQGQCGAVARGFARNPGRVRSLVSTFDHWSRLIAGHV